MKYPRRTSLEAYRIITGRGLLSPARDRVYRWLFDNGPATGSELNEALGEGDDKAGRRMGTGYHKRLSELKDLGVVYEVRERRCRVTGRTAIAWDVTEIIPRTRAARRVPNPRPTPVMIAEALRVFDFWERCADMRGDARSAEVDAVVGWLRRKSA